MKRTLLTLLLLLSFDFISAQDTEFTTLILVRHAEKADDGTRDPNLSEEGLKRAKSLNRLLSKAEINAIYATPYRRTKQTVTPIATAYGLSIEIYSPRIVNSLFSKILEKHSGETILIAGHSNTTPMIANSILGKKRFETFDEDEYDKILIITSDGQNNHKVTVLTY